MAKIIRPAPRRVPQFAQHECKCGALIEYEAADISPRDQLTCPSCGILEHRDAMLWVDRVMRTGQVVKCPDCRGTGRRSFGKYCGRCIDGWL